MSDPHASTRADLAAFTADGEVTGLWSIGPHPADLVLRDGYLMPRPPGQILPRDARIATLARRREPDAAASVLVVEGANLLLGGRRLRPGSPRVLGDGDTLVVDPNDIGEPPGAVLGGLLVRLPPDSPRPLTWFEEAGDGSVVVTRPGAGRGLLHAAIAAAVLGALPAAAAALARPPGSRSREILVLAALGLGALAAVGTAASRVLGAGGSRWSWNDRELVRSSVGGLRGPSDRWAAAAVDGLSVRLGKSAAGAWCLRPILLVRGAEIPLEVGRHMTAPRGPNLPSVARLEARRLDWVAVASRIAAAFGRHPDAFRTVQTDPDWPPERARRAIAAGRFSLS